MLAVVPLIGCTRSNAAAGVAPEFPYESYLKNAYEGYGFPVIADDGGGFEGISSKIRYPELPADLRQNLYADSLLQYYNTILAFNTMAYDVSTAERLMTPDHICIDQANALDSICLSGIKNADIRESLRTCSKRAAQLIREGKSPNEVGIDEVCRFYEFFNHYKTPLLAGHEPVEYDASEVLPDIDIIHRQATTDTALYKDKLRYKVLTTTDFKRKCALAREYAYANYMSNYRDDKELVAVIDQILRSEQYSPLLYDLWLRWRTALQTNIFSGSSKDSAMYNLFYNDMRNRVALMYIKRLAVNPDDAVAFTAFCDLVNEYNIVRTSTTPFGNNAVDDELYLYQNCWEQ